jgi:hypothetical protein
MAETIGLDIGSHSIKLVGLKTTSKGPFLTCLGTREIPYAVDKQNVAAVSEILRGLVSEVGLKSNKVTATTPVTNSLDPSGRLPSGVTITSATYTLIFNSLGEPTSIPAVSPYYVDLTVSAGGLTKTVRTWCFTGKVAIL